MEQNLSSTQDQLSARVSEVRDSDWLLKPKSLFTNLPSFDQIGANFLQMFCTSFASVVNTEFTEPKKTDTFIHNC